MNPNFKLRSLVLTALSSGLLSGLLSGAVGCGGVVSPTTNSDDAALSAVSLPGKVEAEAYLTGGEGVGYHDTTSGNSGGQDRTDGVDIEKTTDSGGGYDVGWIEAGEWLAYSVNVSQAGSYRFTARSASAFAGAKALHVEVDGKELVSGTFSDASGWQSWKSVVLGTGTLTAGTHTLKVVFDSRKQNLNYLQVDLVQAQCGMSDKLVPSCGMLLGAASDGRGGAQNFAARMGEHEARIGRKLDLPHYYAGNNVPLNQSTQDGKDAVALAKGGRYPLIDWKVGGTWAQIASGAEDSLVDQGAANFKAQAPLKFFLSFYHEPEDNVNQTAGSGYTAADFAAAFRHIHDRFAKDGVTNVVWFINYMGYVPHWAGIFKELWPGNDYVDWVFWDPYGTDFATTFYGPQSFYTWMKNNSDATHAFTSKPWGLAEYGVGHGTQAQAYKFYDDMKADLDAKAHPEMKAVTYFDLLYSVTNFRLDETATVPGTHDAVEQAHYNAFANDTLMKH